MSGTFAVLSNNFMYAATAVFALAMLAHAAEWAYARERRTAAARPAAVPVGAPAVAAVSAGGVAVDEPAIDEDSGSDESAVDRAALFGRIGVALTVVATFLLGSGVLTRGLAAERVPWSNLYEFTISGTFVLCTAYLLARRKFQLHWLALPLTGLALVLIVVAIILLYTPVAGLIPALRSYWLIIHVSAACIATGVFTIGALTSVLQLLRARAERTAAPDDGVRGYLRQLPAAATIERLSYRLHAFAFPVWTFALITGAIWAREAWGRYWGWDPKEVWMFITWVCYAAFLHARATAGWRDKSSWLALIGFLALLFNLIGVNLFLAGLHSYA